MQFLKSGKGKSRQYLVPARQPILRQTSEFTLLRRKANEATIRRYEKKKHPFRLLDLPRELRDIIYSYHAADLQNAHEVAMTGHPPASIRTLEDFVETQLRCDAHGTLCDPEPKERRTLANLKIAPLAQVCRRIRREFLQIMFKEGAFDIVVGATKIRTPDDASLRRSLQDVIRGAKDKDDPLFLQRHMIAPTSPDIVFQHVRFKLFLPRPIRRFMGRWDAHAWEMMAPPPSEISFKWSGGRLGMKTWSERGKGQRFDLADVADEMVSRDDVQTAREICARENFRGFTVADLRRIAHAMVQQSLQGLEPVRLTRTIE